MLRNCFLCLCLAGPAPAQDLTALESLFVDSCSRHEALAAEMARGRGSNSSNIREFLVWVEINTLVETFRALTGELDSRNEVLRFIVSRCQEDPTEPIFGILYQQYTLDRLEDMRDRLQREQELVRQIDELERDLASALRARLQLEAEIDDLRED